MKWGLWKSDFLYNSRDLQLAYWLVMSFNPVSLLLCHFGFLLIVTSLLAAVTDLMRKRFSLAHISGVQEVGESSVRSGSVCDSWSLQCSYSHHGGSGSRVLTQTQILPLVAYIYVRFHSQRLHVSQNSTNSWWNRCPCPWACGGHLRLKPKY